MTDSISIRYAERLSRVELEQAGARFCADCGSHQEYALLEADGGGLAAYRMDRDEGRRVAQAEDAESAAQLGRLVEWAF
ncbi:MAG: hypothetical protein GWM90_13465 [Gemmatimonadetes bacterium]|nr:hypothetical protein [Gemmatimonadota bacterium]NIQ55092.1 hypothetical protein [Gemmatimonadota bacterium]NIU75281.1 hypothetical protein [Gammaproteobacteria bacterium]NIX45082.1 hypothetical protein [Gemmatimonadota bacterium]NIY09325.1 hypothetical protein [Gemmatimonadota bacterium]